MAPEPPYVRAAGRFGAVGYDRILALTMREGAWRPQLAAEALADDPAAVLDLGCGTGALTLELERAAPESVRLVGLDGDHEVLDRAREKAGPDSRIEWFEGLAGSLPFAAGSFDRIVSSLLFHHLVPEQKAAALAEARRVLAPGGRLHVADWGRAQDPLMRAAFFGLQLLDGFANTRDHPAGRLPGLIEDAGFARVESRGRLRTTWGSLELLTAR